ncbi:MFS transporter [Azospirillum sp. TSO22-1]|uniref:MFS transporter n=1 Tax=Azospirillum sp. TSO22-1 TaxID=716789 RepID=UPI001FFF6CBE|nr:MFS transporter [Azospirillum sp. TSO22-1]
MLAAVGLLARRAPALFDAVARAPLRGLALAGAAAGTVTLGALAAMGAEAAQLLAADAAVVLLVVLLLAHEALRLLAARTAVAPGEGVGSLAGIRAALFLFMLAEELSRSFLPLYVRELYTPLPGLSDTLAMGLPIALFMLLVAVFTPFAGVWADRFGSRRTLLFGTLPAVAGFVGTAAAQTLPELLVWRSACALGYAVMFIGAQGFIARHTGRQDRARGMAQFVVAVVVAGLCGAPVGGILADHLGPRTVFWVSAALALASALAARGLLPSEAPERAERAVAWRDYALVLANRRFQALLLLSSVPTKVMLTGWLFYLVPVHLHDLGATPATIGRTMMAYGLTIVLLGPWLSRMADRSGRHALFAGAGGLVGGGGALAVLHSPGPAAVLAGVAALGLAHALNNATQLALVPEVARAECARIGRTSVFAIYRLLERAGAVLGPVIAAALADWFGAVAALGALGVLSLLTSAAFCAVFVRDAAALPQTVGEGAP